MRSIAASFICLSLATAFPSAAQTVSRDPAQAPGGTYTADAGHTQVLFSLLHLGLTDYYGRFDRISGTLNYDPSQPERSTLDITIDTTSLDTTSDRLNNELKTVFRAQQYPGATFRSTSVTRTGPNTGRVDGVLTIDDVTKPVALNVTFNGSEKNPMGGGYALGFQATTTIRRSDFGLNKAMWSPYVGDDVKLIIEAMFDQKPG